jgi:5-bromo-4-chloroindolyl phosphate hydrolysis protein
MTPFVEAAQTAPETPVRANYGQRFNALKSGWTAKTALLPGENIEAYHALLREIFEDQNPQGALEVKLVAAMVKAEWRTMRIGSAEAEVLEKHELGSKEYNNWACYLKEARAEFKNSLNLLMSLRRLKIQQQKFQETQIEEEAYPQGKTTRKRPVPETKVEFWLEKVLGGVDKTEMKEVSSTNGMQTTK